MKTIQLLAIELENFRSFKQPTLVELSSGGGLKFISGANQVEPRLGPNGAGKSTLWDAVSYCVTGASVRGVRASDLASWGGGKPRVMTAWDINGEVLTIERHGSPDRILLDDAPVDQATIDRTIGLSRGRFLQSVIFGQAVPLFIDLSGPERSALLDEVLNLGVWLKAAEVASKRHGEHEKTISDLDRQFAFLQGKCAGFENADSINAAIDQWETQQSARIDSLLSDVETFEEKVSAAQKALTKTSKDILPTYDDIEHQVSIHQAKLDEWRASLAQQEQLKTQADQMIEFYTHTKVCSECAQDITSEHAIERIIRFTTVLMDAAKVIKGRQAQIEVVADKLQKIRAEASSIRQAREQFIARQRIAQSEHEHALQNLQRAINVAEQISTADNPHKARQAALLAEIAETEAAIKQAERSRRITQADIIRTDFWKAAFKRVRLFMVRRVLAQLQVETASAAEALGLIGWEITFSTELETKSGSVRPGVHIAVKSPQATAPWEAWSGGEGQRIRLAVTLGLSSLIQRLAGVSIGFEVHDEPSAWLSQEGIEDLVTHLQHRAQVTGKSIWLCDHRALSQAAFDEVWQVTKTREGSQVSMVSAHD